MAAPGKQVDLDELRRLHGEGFGRNFVVRETGWSRRQVDAAAKQLGIEWDRARTTKATQARLADLNDELSHTLGDVAAEAARRLLVEIAKPNIDAHVVRALTQAAGMSAERVAHLAERVGVEQYSPGLMEIEVFSASVTKAYEELKEQSNINEE